MTTPTIQDFDWMIMLSAFFNIAISSQLVETSYWKDHFEEFRNSRPPALYLIIYTYLYLWCFVFFVLIFVVLLVC